MTRQRLRDQIDAAWAALQEPIAGLTDEELLEPGVMGDWSVKDILAHITAWEEEALRHLPVILEGGRPPRYATVYGGIDAFNAQMAPQKRALSLDDVRRQFVATHQRLLTCLERVPPEALVGDTRFRRRLRLDTYGHYPLHARAIRAWRKRRAAG
ncbi:MAG: DinB family protein [Sphaerobacter sp.]|nr:DinB family protein [Sphaerobacter sp.]